MMLWRVGFIGSDQAGRTWWHRILAPGYAHCWAARRLCRNLWLWVEWCPERLVCGLMSSAHVRQMSKAAAVVIVYEQPPTPPRRPRLPVMPFHHCAGIIAHALSLPGWGITPWRLACALRRRGALALMRLDHG